MGIIAQFFFFLKKKRKVTSCGLKMKLFSHDSSLEDGVTVSQGGPLDRRGLEIWDPEKREPWTRGGGL